MEDAAQGVQWPGPDNGDRIAQRTGKKARVELSEVIVVYCSSAVGEFVRLSIAFVVLFPDMGGLGASLTPEPSRRHTSGRRLAGQLQEVRARRDGETGTGS